MARSEVWLVARSVAWLVAVPTYRRNRTRNNIRYASRGLEEPAHASRGWAGSAGGTFFPVVLLCQFLVLAGNRFWLYILRVPYHTVVVLC